MCRRIDRVCRLTLWRTNRVDRRCFDEADAAQPRLVGRQDYDVEAVLLSSRLEQRSGLHNDQHLAATVRVRGTPAASGAITLTDWAAASGAAVPSSAVDSTNRLRNSARRTIRSIRDSGRLVNGTPAIRHRERRSEAPLRRPPGTGLIIAVSADGFRTIASGQASDKPRTSLGGRAERGAGTPPASRPLGAGVMRTCSRSIW